jgi:tetratricopeptide (TPR) repeat protein/tRNA A-37 threonylcarbamoyl transferase component Bud32
MSTPSPSTDRNLLLGILALQMDFVSRDALIAAMHAWVLQKTTPLGQILLEQGALRSDTQALLEALVEKHLEMHGGDAQQSLAAVSSVGSLRNDLEHLADPDLHASLAHVSAARNEDVPATRPPASGQDEEEAPPTRPPSVGTPTSSGLRFRILRPHARGGLGEVFVARDEELHREVALKEIQGRHADHADSRTRFVREAEITGGLEHPGIVPVYGLGHYADGRPYYAMRFIRGDSLQQAIETFHRADVPGRDPGEQALGLRQLLGRFVDVCNAIAYAHSRGVLHRDLKPGNVMLGQYGETLVVDWGLAKAGGETGETATPAEGPLKPASGSGSAPTQMGTAVGTPQYMSPEQAAGRLDLLGPASDVYSLGATLYCLLTGKVPFDAADVGALLQRVQKGEFPPPRQLKRNVPAALEAVCLKAMALNQQDRYASTRALADDIEHWLADEPVIAWREPLAVRAGRWVRRHRVLAASTAAGLVVALVLVSGGAVWLEQRKEQERRERLAQQERAREQAEAGLAQAVALRQGYRYADAKAMLEQVHGWARQASDRDLDTRVNQADADLVLARDLDRVRQEAATLIEGKWGAARMLEEFPAVLARHGMDVLAGDLDELSQTIRASAVRQDIVAALDNWTLVEINLQRFHRLVGLANCADELDPWRQAVRAGIAQGDRQRLVQLVRVTGEGKATPGVVLLLAHAFGPRSEEATGLLRRMQLERPHDFWVNFELGKHLYEQKKYQEAVECYLVAVALRSYSPLAHSNLGVALHAKGKVDEAIACYQKAIAIDPKHAPAHYNLGSAWYGKRKVDEAIACFHRASVLDPKLAPAHNNLGWALQGQGKTDEAIACYQKAIAIDPKYAPAHINLGAALGNKGKVDEAIASYHKAIACYHKVIDIDPRFAKAYTGLGVCLHGKGKVDEAIVYYKKAIEIDPKYAWAHNNLGFALQAKGEVDEAIESYRRAIAFDPKDAHAHSGLGVALHGKGKVDEAIECYQKAIGIDPRFANAHNNLGWALQGQGKTDEAIACYQKAIGIAPNHAKAHHNLGTALVQQGKLDEARAAFRQAFRDRSSADAFFANALTRAGRLDEALAAAREAVRLGPNSPWAHQNLGWVLLKQKKWDGAIAAYRATVRLQPENVTAHHELGITLAEKGLLEEAIACFHRAIALAPRFADAHYDLGIALGAKRKEDEAIASFKSAIAVAPTHAHAYGALGQTLMQQGQFIEAQKALRRCLVLLPANHPNRAFTSQLLRQCQELLDTQGKLKAFLAGKEAPADPTSQVQMAGLAQQPFNRLYLCAVRLYRDALARQPRLADAHRYNAARSAVLTAAGQADDARVLPDRVVLMLRKQAQRWLRADLAFYARLAEQTDPQGRQMVRQRLTHWRADTDLASVRDKPGLARLDADERQQWQRLWEEVDALLRKVAAKK